MKKRIILGTLFLLCVAGAVFGLEQFGVRLTIVKLDRPLDATSNLVPVDLVDTGNEEAVVRVAEPPKTEPFASAFPDFEPSGELAAAEPPAQQTSGASDAAPPADSIAPSPLNASEQPVASPAAAQPGPPIPVDEADFGLPLSAEQKTSTSNSAAPAVEAQASATPRPGPSAPPVPQHTQNPFTVSSDANQSRPAYGPSPSEPPLTLNDFVGSDAFSREKSPNERFPNERIEILARELQDKQSRFVPHHSEVQKARQALEFEVRRALQRRREQQQQEIARLRERLTEIEQRLNERAAREDELVTALLASLVAGPPDSGKQTVLPPSDLNPATRPGIFSPLDDPRLPTPVPNTDRSSAYPAGSINPSQEPPRGPLDAVSKLLEQLTVRVTWQYEQKPGFIAHGSLDGVLLTDRGLVVSALPAGMLTEGARKTLELTIVFPATRTTAVARLAAVNEPTGLALLQPDLFPDATPKLELAVDEIASGTWVCVATVQDGQFRPEDVSVAAFTGHARRLVGRQGTASRLATDISSQPGSGGAPLLTYQGKLGGIMSARDPGQYLGAREIERLLASVNDGALQLELEKFWQEAGQNQPVSARQFLTQDPQDRQSSLQSSLQTSFDQALGLVREIAEAQFDAEQARLERDRLEALVRQKVISNSEFNKAEIAARHADSRLALLLQQALVRRQRCELSLRFAKSSLETARAGYEQAAAAYKTGSIPATELSRLKLEMDQRDLEVELAQQTLDLLDQLQARLPQAPVQDTTGVKPASGPEQPGQPEIPSRAAPDTTDSTRRTEAPETPEAADPFLNRIPEASPSNRSDLFQTGESRQSPASDNPLRSSTPESTEPKD
ncbi:hypothetical protein GC176_04245 [bacterium]|nr:hypothetical protein [bacterium]